MSESHSKGFTLLEVLVTAVLLLITVTFTGRYFISSTVATHRSDEVFKASEIAFTQLEIAKSRLANYPDSMDFLLSQLGDTLSKMSFTAVANGWGPAEVDASNGEWSAGDGLPLTINGTVYSRGLGVHAYSELVWVLNGQFETFKSDIGVDDEVGASAGSVKFLVYLDGNLQYQSSTMTGAMPAKSISVDVSGGNQLKLVVEPTADGTGYDHGDWANARLLSTRVDSLVIRQHNRDYPVYLHYRNVSSYFKAVSLVAEVEWDTNRRTRIGTGVSYP